MLRNRHLRDPSLRGLPEDLRTERRQGRVFDPNEGLQLDWTNRYKTVNFGFKTKPQSETALQDNLLRCYLLVQNLDPVSNLFLSFTTDANFFGSVRILPGGNYELIGGEAGGSFVPSGSVNLLGALPDMSITIVEGTLSPYPMNL